MERLHIKTVKMVNPLCNEPKFAFSISMNNTDYERGEVKILQTYMLTDFENEDVFKQCFFNGCFNNPQKEIILNTVFNCLNHPCKNESFQAIFDKIIDDGPNGDIDGTYVDWNDIRASLVRCKLIKK